MTLSMRNIQQRRTNRLDRPSHLAGELGMGFTAKRPGNAEWSLLPDPRDSAEQTRMGVRSPTPGRRHAPIGVARPTTLERMSA
jgi:hypothetical protein